MTTTNQWFAKMAQKTAKVTGSSPAFLAICTLTVVWLATGPIFHWSDTWQLIINTFTNIVSMLMIFLIQNTQNRESAALQLKVDELLRAVRGAQHAFINLEDLTEEDLERIKERYAKMAERARTKSSVFPTPESLRSQPSKESAGLSGPWKCHTGSMARGWESKSVESQIESAEAREALAKLPRLTSDELDRNRQRESLQLQRTRVLHDIESSQNAGYRAILQGALKHLDDKLAALE